MIDHKKGKWPVLSISLLVSNHIDTIRKCMESIKPLLEALPSELIAVDTGCTDGSIDIVNEYADEIIQFTWCHDFSKARNAGLERATGEWFLYLDDDEWFEDVSEIIQFFESGEYKAYDHAWYMQRNYDDAEGSTYSDFYVGRMCKNVPGLHFEHRVHECFSTNYKEVKLFSAYVHHYGYVFRTPEEKRKKSERNISLVEIEYEENPHDLRMVSQLVQEYMAIGWYDKAETVIKKTWEDNQRYKMNPFMQHLLVCLPRLEKKREKWDAAEEKVTDLEQNYSLITLAKIACVAEHVIIAVHDKNYNLILEKLPKYFELYEEIQNGGEDLRKQQMMDFVHYASEDMKRQMVLSGVRAMLQLHDFSMSEFIYGKIDWKEETEQPRELCLACMQSYAESGIAEAFYPFVEQMLQNEKMKEALVENADKLFLRNSEIRENFVQEMEKLQRQELYFKMLHAEYCLLQEKPEIVKEAIREYFVVSKGKYDARFAALFLPEPEYVNEVLGNIDMQTLTEAVAYALKEGILDKLVQNLEVLENVWDKKKELYFRYFKMAVQEEYILLATEHITEALWQYIEEVLLYTELYYNKTVLQQKNWRMLPRNSRFALWMKQAALCKNVGDRNGWMERVKQASEIYPPMIPVVQASLEEEAKKQKKATVSPELQALAAQLKQNIRELMQLGQKAEAKELLVALEQYVPEDEDIVSLHEQLRM